jgi:IS4 transposase
MKLNRIDSNDSYKAEGITCDQVVSFVTKDAQKHYPGKFRRIKYKDIKTGETFVFITNNFEIPATTVADLYKARWRIEIFFKWINKT